MKMKVIVKRPDEEYGRFVYIENKLKTLQQIVGGYNDLTLNRYVNSGEVITVTPERVAILIKVGFARRED